MNSTTSETRVETRAYKPNEVAEMLSCDTSTVYRLIDSGRLRAVRLGRVLRITQTALDEFLGA